MDSRYRDVAAVIARPGSLPWVSLAYIGISSLFEFSVTAFWFYAGLRLWSIRPGAVRLAKNYLLCYAFYVVVSATVETLVSHTLHIRSSPVDFEELIQREFKDVARGLISAAIWYLYLSVSKRVKATYLS